MAQEPDTFPVEVSKRLWVYLIETLFIGHLNFFIALNELILENIYLHLKC